MKAGTKGRILGQACEKTPGIKDISTLGPGDVRTWDDLNTVNVLCIV